jgi:hypothetical protein
MDMPRRASDNTVQVSIRIPQAWVDRADALTAACNKQGLMIGRATRADILRASVGRGLDSLEAAERKPAPKGRHK